MPSSILKKYSPGLHRISDVDIISRLFWAKTRYCGVVLRFRGVMDCTSQLLNPTVGGLISTRDNERLLEIDMGMRIKKWVIRFR